MGITRGNPPQIGNFDGKEPKWPSGWSRGVSTNWSRVRFRGLTFYLRDGELKRLSGIQEIPKRSTADPVVKAVA